MARLEDIMPETLTPNKKNSPKKRKNTEQVKKATGRKRRAWLENDDSSDDIIEDEKVGRSIDFLNDVSLSQTKSYEDEFKHQKGGEEKGAVGSIKKSKNSSQRASKSPVSSLGPNKTSKKEMIHEHNPFRIKRWSEKDRPQNELGNIEDLSKSFKLVGQQVPCIVRPIKEKDYDYELIIGECRWEAAKLAEMPLKIIIRDLDDHMACLAQAVENEKRKDLSEFAKGMSYANKIEKGFLSQKDLIDILGISKQQVSRLLSFKKIPPALFEAIEDFRLVSARTAEELCRLSNKGKEYINALIEIAPKIKTGKYGHKSINRDLKKRLEKGTTPEKLNTKVYSSDGRHLFTWRLDNNSVPSIHFPNNIMKLVKEEKLNFDELTKEVKQWLTNKLLNLN